MRAMPVHDHLSNLPSPTRRNWFSFVSLMVMLVQNSFNDKAVQFLLVALGVALTKISAEGVPTSIAHIEYILAGLIVTPFIVLAPLAGWVSDRFSKTRVIRYSSWFQLCVLACLFLCLSQQWIVAAIATFFLLAVQSTFLSPAKMGIIKELVGSKQLGFASGIVEMGTILAILAGSILMSFWYDHRLFAGLDPWEAALFPVCLLLCLGPVSTLCSYGIEAVQASSQLPFRWGLMFNHLEQLKVVMRQRSLRLSAFGVAFFWTFGGFIQLVSIQVAKENNLHSLGGEASSLAWMMLVSGLGIALGSLAASWISKRGIELGLVPVGGFVMALATAWIGLCSPESVAFYVAMSVAGAGAAMFLVPLNATLQDASLPSERGSVLAASNLLNCFGGLGAVGLQLILKQNGVSVSAQFFLFGALALWATWVATRLLPQQTLRFVILAMFRFIYKIKIEGVAQMPKSGGVLLLANHVSYIDSLVLSAASPRPIRFLMDEKLIAQGGVVAKFAKLFGTVPISPARAKDAIQITADALKAGDVVCIFPEGQLTRSGCMNELKKGYQLMARRAGVPVLPVYMDGLWGSISSFERQRYFKKWPYTLKYGVSVVYGEPLNAKEASTERVRSELYDLGALAFQQRDLLTKPEKVFSRTLLLREGDDAADVHPFQAAQRQLLESSPEQQRLILTNALQLAGGCGFERSMDLIVDADSLGESLVNVVAFALVLKARLSTPNSNGQTGGGQSELRKKRTKVLIVGNDFSMEGLAGENELDCYRVSSKPMLENSSHGYVIGYRHSLFLTRSMPHLTAQQRGQDSQIGWKPKSLGRLLPGFSYREHDRADDGEGSTRGMKSLELSLAGVEQTFLLNAEVDEEGFVFPRMTCDA